MIWHVQIKSLGKESEAPDVLVNLPDMKLSYNVTTLLYFPRCIIGVAWQNIRAPIVLLSSDNCRNTESHFVKKIRPIQWVESTYVLAAYTYAIIETDFQFSSRWTLCLIFKRRTVASLREKCNHPFLRKCDYCMGRVSSIRNIKDTEKKAIWKVPNLIRIDNPATSLETGLHRTCYLWWCWHDNEIYISVPANALNKIDVKRFIF